MSLPVLLFIIFLVLKLVGVIAWSWIWVTAPLWIPFLICVVLAACGVSLVGFASRQATKRHADFRKRHGFR